MVKKIFFILVFPLTVFASKPVNMCGVYFSDAGAIPSKPFRDQFYPLGNSSYHINTEKNYVVQLDSANNIRDVFVVPKISRSELTQIQWVTMDDNRLLHFYYRNRRDDAYRATFGLDRSGKTKFLEQRKIRKIDLQKVRAGPMGLQRQLLALGFKPDPTAKGLYTYKHDGLSLVTSVESSFSKLLIGVSLFGANEKVLRDGTRIVRIANVTSKQPHSLEYEIFENSLILRDDIFNYVYTSEGQLIKTELLIDLYDYPLRVQDELYPAAPKKGIYEFNRYANSFRNDALIKELQTLFGKETISRESLSEKLREDNKYVVEQGLNHLEIARPYMLLINILESHPQITEVFIDKVPFKVHVSRIVWESVPKLPWNSRYSLFIGLKNMQTGEQIEFSGLTAELAYKYGLYVSYRKPHFGPKDLLAVFKE